MSQDEAYMSRCLELAARGGRSVMPNPLVGAVIVCDGAVIGEGYHQRYGEPHAEVHAVHSVTDRSMLARSTIYVSLEPCSHFGRTPPCADLILESSIPRVVVGCTDPNPRVAGAGISRLRQSGVEVIEGVLRNECIAINRRFMLAHREKRPYITLKWAQTDDGFIARSDGSSKWISCEQSRTRVHSWRAHEMAILVGASTAVIDDPHLTVRLASGVDPIRIAVDPDLRISRSAHIYRPPPATRIYNLHRSETLGDVTLVRCESRATFLAELLSDLYSQKITSLFVEGGSRTLQAFIQSGAWDEARVFTSKATFGIGISAPAIGVSPIDHTKCGEDSLDVYLNPSTPHRIGLERPDALVDAVMHDL